MPEIRTIEHHSEYDCDEDGNPVIYYTREVVGPRCWINIYDENRAYGGPEEGGWWYTYGEIVRSIRVPLAHVERVRARVQSACDRANAGNPGLGSVACAGVYAVRVERGPGRSYPQERPRYE